MVRKSTVRRDPIGSRSEALNRIKTRESFRKQIVDNEIHGLSMNTENLLQYNPKLADVSHTTRVAYAKFMTTKIKKEIKFEDDEIKFVNEKERARGAMAFNKFKSNAGILKKTIQPEKSENVVTIETVPPSTPSPSPVPDEEEKDFRVRTPIQEDPNEDVKSPTPTQSVDLLDSVSRKSSRDDSPMPKQRTESIGSAKILSTEPSSSKENISEESALSKSPQPPKSPIPKSPEPILPSKVPEIDETEEEEEKSSFEPPKSPRKSLDEKEVPTPRKNSSDLLSVPGASQPPSSPSLSISSGDKGKSKITGKTLTGWL